MRSLIDDRALSRDGDARTAAEAVGEHVQRIVDAFRLVVGKQDASRTCMPGKAHCVVRRRVTERRLGGNLVR